jgi:hypothetical protein
VVGQGRMTGLTSPWTTPNVVYPLLTLLTLQRKERFMDKLDVKLRLEDVQCFDEADGPGSAEPYLWTVFFKIDGTTTVVTDQFALAGTATVSGTQGNHRDLGPGGVDAGDDILIPPFLGEFATRLVPITLQQPVGNTTEIGGAVGAITVLLEQDNTPNSAIANGHRALDKAVRDTLNELIPKLTIAHRAPTPEEIEAMKKKIGDKVENEISDNVDIFDWLSGLGNMDDKIGSEVFIFSHDELAARGVSGISFSQRFRNQGDWKIDGFIRATPVGVQPGSLSVVLAGVPDHLAKFPVMVQGPGFLRNINRTQTLVDMVPGEYNIIASGFSTGDNHPTCRVFTPDVRTQQVEVKSGQTASVTVRYTSEPCDLQEDRAVEAATIL